MGLAYAITDTRDKPMKFLNLIAALTLIASPVQATTDQQQKRLEALQERALQQLRNKDYAGTCKTYQKYYDYRVSIGHHEFDQITGTAQRQKIIREINKTISDINSSQNKNGPIICNRAGMDWGRPALPVLQSASGSSVSQNIRERCEREWGTDYAMIRYCIDRQTEAAESLGY
jgi:hypothetical protein